MRPRYCRHHWLFFSRKKKEIYSVDLLAQVSQTESHRQKGNQRESQDKDKLVDSTNSPWLIQPTQ
jgi:hypothetical protein